MADTKQTPLEEQRKEALEYYEEISAEVCWHNSFVKNAILAYNPHQEEKQSSDDAYEEMLKSEAQEQLPIVSDKGAEDLNNFLGSVKWRIGKVITEKFLEYNEGKFNSAIELNPAVHAASEFCEEYALLKREQARNELFKQLEELAKKYYGGEMLKRVYEELEKLKK